jgi:hypothetical protein
MERYEEAERLYMQCLNAQEHSVGLEHPETWNTMLNLSHVNKELGHYDQAEMFCTQCYDYQKKAYGMKFFCLCIASIIGLLNKGYYSFL